jgi:hypothetical protein
MSQTLTNQMQSTVDASNRTECKNTQWVEDVVGCDIRFGKQICNVQTLAKALVTNDSKTDMSQKLANSMSQSSKALTKGGLGIGNTSHASASMKNIVDVAMSAATSMYSNCSADMSLVNVQLVKNCRNSSIDFAEQQIDGSLVTECVVGQSAQSSAMQDVVNSLSQTASATTKGLSIMDLLLPLLIIPLMIFLVILAIRKGFTAFRAKPRVMSGYTRAGIALMIIFGLLLGLWWPGYGSFRLGLWPWPYPGTQTPGSDGKPLCYKGKTDMSKTINYFGFADPNCLLARGSDPDAPCSDDDAIVHYKGCGVIGGGCDDPLLKQEKQNFQRAAVACGDLIGYAGCNHATLSSQFFTKPEKLKDTEAINGCRYCDEGPAKGMYVRLDASCKEAKVDLLRFKGQEEKSFTREGKVYDACSNLPAGTNCVQTDEALLKGDNADDCTDDTYQLRKKGYVVTRMHCMQLAEVVGRPVDDLNLSSLCPPKAEDFLSKCKGIACSYSAVTGTPSEVASCKNDYTDCQNEDYLTDLKVATKEAQYCERKYGLWEGRRAPYLGVGIGLEAVIFLMMIALFVFGERARRAQQGVADQSGGARKK